MRGVKQNEMFEISDFRREILHHRPGCPFVHQFKPVSVHQFKPFPIKCIKVGFFPSGLLSQWAFVLAGFCPVGFCPSGLLS